MHINHRRGEGFNRRKAADYPYNDSSYHQGIQAAARKVRRRDDGRTTREGLRAYREQGQLDPDVPLLVLLRE
jgi:hypothetical protein